MPWVLFGLVAWIALSLAVTPTLGRVLSHLSSTEEARVEDVLLADEQEPRTWGVA